MKNNLIFLTVGDLAKLHQINKRTLHFYDEIGIFSPKFRKENGYRYYTLEQSMDLENILYLRELGMSIDSIKEYIKNPNSEDFMNIANNRIEEIDKAIYRLKSLKTDFMKKKQLLIECNNIYHSKIEVIQRQKRYFFITRLPINFETREVLINNSPHILSHIKEAKSIGGYYTNCGSFISIDKIRNKKFKYYDGIFSELNMKKKHIYVMEKGKYLRGFCVGDWNNIPYVYEKMLEYADKNNLILSEYAFESGMNEFAIKSEDEYITQIEILCK